MDEKWRKVFFIFYSSFELIDYSIYFFLSFSFFLFLSTFFSFSQIFIQYSQWKKKIQWTRKCLLSFSLFRKNLQQKRKKRKKKEKKEKREEEEEKEEDEGIIWTSSEDVLFHPLPLFRIFSQISSELSPLPSFLLGTK